MNWTAVGIVGTLVVSFIGAVFGLIQSRAAAKAARESVKSQATTATIELGVRSLVDQYRESNEELRDEVHECKGKCDQLQAEVKVLTSEVQRLAAVLDDREAEIIRLRRQVGGL